MQALAAIRSAGLTERHAGRCCASRSEEEVATALETILRDRLNVRQTEEYIDSLTVAAGGPPRALRPVIVLKDVGIFLNTLDRSLALLRTGSVDAVCERTETDSELTLTIRIPKRRLHIRRMSSSTSSGRVAQLAARRTTVRPSGRFSPEAVGGGGAEARQRRIVQRQELLVRGRFDVEFIALLRRPRSSRSAMATAWPARRR